MDYPEAPDKYPTYARRLGLFSGTMAVIGGIIGSGIFLNPRYVALRVHTPFLTLGVWVLGGAIALAGAFCFGELGNRSPRAGGGYVYLRDAYGGLPAFLYGWMILLVIGTGAIAAVAVSSVWKRLTANWRSKPATPNTFARDTAPLGPIPIGSSS